MALRSINEVHNYLRGAVKETKTGVEVTDEVRVQGAMDRLMYEAMFNPDKAVSDEIKRLVVAAAKALGIWPASIQGLYAAMGKGQASGFTVPAINIRGFTFETARAAFRAAMKHNAGAFIFEIAKSEISYTAQRPSEYAANCLAAAVKEGYRGPVFIQGDHFQINAKKFKENGDAEMDGLKRLIKEALEAGFYNIDIDSSTIVDLGKPSADEEQRPNYEATAALAGFIRESQPDGVAVSIGGEIGEVGGRNSTEEDLRAFMDGLAKTLKKDAQGISKISIQTGTSHGGVVLADGSVAKVKVDFDTMERLSKIARESYGLAGIVQHGASTLPDDAFDMFTKKGAAEVHLATGFQNLLFESHAFPYELKNDIYKYLDEKCADEKKPEDTAEQFHYKTRKKAFGPFKERIWNIDDESKALLGVELEARFGLLFDKFNLRDTAPVVKKFVA